MTGVVAAKSHGAGVEVCLYQKRWCADDSFVQTRRRCRRVVAPVGDVVDDGSGGTAAPAVGRDGPDGRGNTEDSQWYHVGSGDVDVDGGGGNR